MRGLCLAVCWVLGRTSEAARTKVPRFFIPHQPAGTSAIYYIFMLVEFARKVTMVIVIVILSMVKLFSQSVDVEILEYLLKSPKDIGEQFLLNRGYSLISIKPLSDGDTVKKYTNNIEFIDLGRKWRTTDGRSLRDVSYFTEEKEYMLNLMVQLKNDPFKYTDSNKNDQEKITFIYLENDHYKVQITLSMKDNEFSSIKLVEK